MDLGLSGKLAVVVGAGADVGRAAALSLADEGARLVLVGRVEEKLEETRRAIAARNSVSEIAPADCRSTEDVARVVGDIRARFGVPDILVNTVGPFPRGLAADPPYGDDASWSQVFDTVFMTAVRVGREVLPLMKAQGRGAVINLAANSARYYHPNTAQYGAMKSALVHITKNWARDAAAHGVRVNAVLPGWIKTEAMADLVERNARDQDSSVEEIETAMVSGHDRVFWSSRMGRPEEYADVITYLASARASYINGALIPVDGGSPVW